MKDPLVLVINPGSTSTKIGLYCGFQCKETREINHPADELAGFKKNLDQIDYRAKALEAVLADWKIRKGDLNAIIGRGGPLKPMEGGVYHVGEALLADLHSGKLVDHASILGGILACTLAKTLGIPAFIADPVSVDEFEDVARISGLPELPRISLSHSLNIKAVLAEVAAEKGRKPTEMNAVVAHLGGGISIAAIKKGRQIDVNNANDGGPFSPERVGTLPLTGLLKLCYSGKYSHDELKKTLIGKGGLVAHLGTNDVREAIKRIESGDREAKKVLEAMAYTIAKEIGAMAAVLCGKVDCIILTGGVAYSREIVGWITERVGFIAPIVVKPGQNELKALAAHAVRALADASIVREYR